MTVDVASKSPALVSLFNDPNQVITLDANFLIPQRSESSGSHGSITERVQGKQGEIPCPLGRKSRQRLLGPWLALGY